MKTHPFTRPTLIAAVEFLGAASTQATFDQIIVRLGLDGEIPLASPKSVTAKSALMAKAVTQRSIQVIATIDGQMTLAEARSCGPQSMCLSPSPERRNTQHSFAALRSTATSFHGLKPLARRCCVRLCRERLICQQRMTRSISC